MGVTISGPMTVETQDIIHESEQWNTYPIAKEWLKDRGISDEHKPPPIEAKDLSTISSQQYAETASLHNNWFSRVDEVYAEVRAMLLQYETERDMLESRMKKSLAEMNAGLPKTDRLTKEEVEVEIKLLPRNVQLTHHILVMKQILFDINAKLEIAKNNSTLISRNVTVRGQEIEIETRSNNVRMPTRRF